MPTITYGGHSWKLREAAPADALALVTSSGAGDYWGLLVGAVRGEDRIRLALALEMGALPGTAVGDMVEDWLEASTGYPISAVGALCGVVVNEWPMIRGRLVRGGIADPLREVRTLGALLSVVWDMMLEGCKDEKETSRLKAKVFRPTVKRRAVPTREKRQVTDQDLQQQTAMLRGMMTADGEE